MRIPSTVELCILSSPLMDQCWSRSSMAPRLPTSPIQLMVIYSRRWVIQPNRTFTFAVIAGTSPVVWVWLAHFLGTLSTDWSFIIFHIVITINYIRGNLVHQAVPNQFVTLLIVHNYAVDPSVLRAKQQKSQIRLKLIYACQSAHNKPTLGFSTCCVGD